MLVSIIVRTLNEARYLDELLAAVKAQNTASYSVEVVLVDSGSTDQTIEIAESWGVRITYIEKSEFTFGRSLNLGCAFARGDIFVFISGHCVPAGSDWLDNLTSHLRSGESGYSYGRQIGRDSTKYSEMQLFEKYFPDQSRIQTKEFFCNNANSAIAKKVWERYQFDEELMGLEDMYLAKQYINDGGVVAYAAEASVFHIHDETWSQIKRRYEREALALQKIMPEVQLSLVDVIRYVMSAIITDFYAACRDRVFFDEWLSIVRFRLAQYFGSYVGNRTHRQMSRERKESYFYPTDNLKI